MDTSTWEIIYDIVKDFSVPEPDVLPSELLTESLSRELPTDRGISLVEMDDGVPYCISWPDYATPLIPLFNDKLNRDIPQVYNPVSRILGPVSWRSFSHTEYDKSFNVPLDIGYSVGMGIYDPVHNKEMIYCLHKSRNSPGFTDEELQILLLVRPLVQSIFTRRDKLLFRKFETILPREVSPGCRKLSKREREILQFLLTRQSMKEIAGQLGISVRTIETHALHIYQKLCVSSRNDLQHLLSGIPD